MPPPCTALPTQILSKLINWIVRILSQICHQISGNMNISVGTPGQHIRRPVVACQFPTVWCELGLRIVEPFLDQSIGLYADKFPKITTANHCESIYEKWNRQTGKKTIRQTNKQNKRIKKKLMIYGETIFCAKPRAKCHSISYQNCAHSLAWQVQLHSL